MSVGTQSSSAQGTAAADFVDDRSVLARSARAPDSLVRYGQLAEHVTDVRYGTERAPQLPLVLMIHGGFWRPAFDRKHTGPMCEAIADAGWTIASIEYRRIPGQPDATVSDVCNAIAKLPSLIQRHNGTSIVMGHSAGGHLCLYAAAKQATGLAGALALAPAADLIMAERLNLGDGAAVDFLGVPAAHRGDLDPVRLPAAKAPTTILHGFQDAIVPISLSEHFLGSHPATRLVSIDRCGHFGVIDPQSAAWPNVIAELQRLSPP